MSSADSCRDISGSFSLFLHLAADEEKSFSLGDSRANNTASLGYSAFESTSRKFRLEIDSGCREKLRTIEEIIFDGEDAVIISVNDAVIPKIADKEAHGCGIVCDEGRETGELAASCSRRFGSLMG